MVRATPINNPAITILKQTASLWDIKGIVSSLIQDEAIKDKVIEEINKLDDIEKAKINTAITTIKDNIDNLFEGNEFKNKLITAEQQDAINRYIAFCNTILTYSTEHAEEETEELTEEEVNKFLEELETLTPQIAGTDQKGEPKVVKWFWNRFAKMGMWTSLVPSTVFGFSWYVGANHSLPKGSSIAIGLAVGWMIFWSLEFMKHKIIRNIEQASIEDKEFYDNANKTVRKAIKKVFPNKKGSWIALAVKIWISLMCIISMAGDSWAFAGAFRNRKVKIEASAQIEKAIQWIKNVDKKIDQTFNNAVKNRTTSAIATIVNEWTADNNGDPISDKTLQENDAYPREYTKEYVEKIEAIGTKVWYGDKSKAKNYSD